MSVQQQLTYYIDTHGFVGNARQQDNFLVLVQQCGHVPPRFPEELGYQQFAACHVAGTDGAQPFAPPGKAKDKNVHLAPQPWGEA